jgi:glycosyltransferase involved in cell wall biosynthesis
MRILHVLNHAERANGHVEVAVDLACEQVSQGHDVAFISGSNHFVECLEQNGVEVYQLKATGRLLGSALMPFRLFRAAAKFKPDIVNAHMVVSAAAAKLAQIPSKFKLVTTVHNPFDPQAKIMGVGDRIIALGDAVRDELIAKGLNAGRMRVVTNGTIGGARRPKKPESTRTLNHPAIATVAGLHPRKGVSDLIDAFAITAEGHDSCELYIVGDGPDRDLLEAKAGSLPCANRIHFLGYLKDPREVLASTDIFVLASYAEAFPLVLCEARHMECAIIATTVGGNSQALDGGKCGLLVEPGRPDELAQSLSKLLNNKDLRDQMAAAAGGNLYSCSVERMARETLKVYEDALDRPSS